MHPLSSEDIQASIHLVQSYLEGSYTYTRNDLPNLVKLDDYDPDEQESVPLLKTKLNENSFKFFSTNKEITITMDSSVFFECPVCQKQFQRLRPLLKSKKKVFRFN